MSETKVIAALILGLVSLSIGFALPLIIIDIDLGGRYMETINRLAFLVAFFLVIFLFHKVFVRYKTLEGWAKNTLTGILVMLFVAGLLISLFYSVLVLLPVVGWLHLVIVVALGLIY